ncbi:CoB--CoM heterodisulfide reductase iron-sulfur subunit B family protein [Candidatus Oleimmundimicrobium sp.]|uniref:CoB--CoM heterodisulfide reductase iron-sulfur subunit B family protein n=1 Tax=Candidatus Oleimmundimicrobium sp. TaxID=3060597 RepID=UPI002728B0FE|nr:CoB--CoM heterodisulfide reductase iron-sulfur subunit B family protein [Candidatus Oleimmundimicrobium sp.]MDO8886268.1 CoB--CoM heterodisulfide reductase iron-sulfur subunit B family protein [Candidatus Oleimmundimicrobium sp.]
MKYGLYPGCSYRGTAREFGESIDATCSALNLDVKELEDWVCCGASSAHNTSHLLATVLPLHTLISAREAGFEKLLAPCIACAWRLKTAIKEIETDEKLRMKAEKVIGKKYEGGIDVFNIVEFFTKEIKLEKIKKAVKKPLKDLRVVCYYGCMLTRPPKIANFDVVEDPRSLDNIMKILGAESLDWPYKTECCGVSFALSRTDVVIKLCHDLLEEIKKLEVDMVVVACPLCQTNLDTRQKEIEKKYNTKYGIPIVYFTQLMGLALGKTPEDVGLKRLTVNPFPVLKKKGIL